MCGWRWRAPRARLEDFAAPPLRREHARRTFQAGCSARRDCRRAVRTRHASRAARRRAPAMTRTPPLPTAARRGRRIASSRSLDAQKGLHLTPDARQARDELMVVVEQREPDIRTRGRKPLDVAGIDQHVPPSLKYQRRLREECTKGVVLQGVLVEGVRQHAFVAVPVVEELILLALFPDLNLIALQQVMLGIAEPDGRSEQDELVDA